MQTEGTAREGWEQESPSVPLGTLKVHAVEHRRRWSGEGTLDVQRILGSSQEQMESTEKFEQGIFISNLQAH